MAHIIVFGNEKGGTGKSTVCLHVATALARMGRRTGALDLDTRQKSLTRYLESRQAHQARAGIGLPTPDIVHTNVEALCATVMQGPASAGGTGPMAAQALLPGADHIVIDCPGAHTLPSQMAHTLADTLITPLNDSFVDFDLLARIDPETNRIVRPSIYAEMVWEARQRRAKAGLAPTDWIVLRNRLGPQQMRNKRKVGDALNALSRRIGFRVVPGFSERVVFRELFPNGTTLLDIEQTGLSRLTMSNVAARQEVRDLMRALNLPALAALQSPDARTPP